MGKKKILLKSKTICLDSIGPVLLEKSNRAKHIIISIKPFKGIRVAVPTRVSFKTAQEFACTKKNGYKKIF